MSRFHSHVIRDFSSVYIHFTLCEEDAKSLYYALLPLRDCCIVFDVICKLLGTLWK